MSFTVLIPARLGSSRLPNKPLLDLCGLPMVVRVARQAQQSKAKAVVVATDAPAIVEACKTHNVNCLLTRSDHATGSDRLAEACAQLGLPDDDIVVNVQGDEPLVAPIMIDACARTLMDSPDCVIGTVAHAIDDASEFNNPNVVKVVLNGRGEAQYFSRAPIPCWRDAPTSDVLATPSPLRHVGLYSYRAGFLQQFPHLPPSPMESLESLEQLRALWHGHRIAVWVSPHRPGPGVDTPEDLERVRLLL